VKAVPAFVEPTTGRLYLFESVKGEVPGEDPADGLHVIAKL